MMALNCILYLLKCVKKLSNCLANKIFYHFLNWWINNDYTQYYVHKQDFSDLFLDSIYHKPDNRRHYYLKARCNKLFKNQNQEDVVWLYLSRDIDVIYYFWFEFLLLVNNFWINISSFYKNLIPLIFLITT